MNVEKTLLDFAVANPKCIESLEIVFKHNSIPILINSDVWPNSVHSSLIVDETEDNQISMRAKSIVRSFLPDLSEKKLLDFGAGNSKVIQEANNASMTVAYDIKDSGLVDGVITDWNVVKNEGPYDVILLYDVIDHMTDNEGNLCDWDGVTRILLSIKEILAPNGKIFCRCHPWTSRHGVHNYLADNKAFSHYIREDTNLTGIPTIFCNEPCNNYKEIFKAAGMNISKFDVFKQPLPNFFNYGCFDEWRSKIFTWKNGKIFREIMSINFVDCILDVD